MKQLLASILIVGLVCGCHTTRTATVPTAPHIRVLTYNVNWGGARPDLAAEIIQRSGAEIVCLQETTPQWAEYLRQALGRDYQFTQFRDSQNRMGGGLGFLAKVPAHEVAYVPSETGWFDGWIMRFETVIGPVQVINVHLRPPISDGGSWVSGYLTTGDDRRLEMEKFYQARAPQTPTLVLGDFNDGESSAVARWLQGQGLSDALPQFDRYSPTWQWQTSVVTLKRRMDHIFYTPELDCAAARVITAGASDHFPVEAIFTKAR
ncbi:MAG TPA: endonuclease/exonuclease/phosphatase family protein [Verrucomicrobiae bacterium]|nr:endonuclease/exonuclease/phosphatase family protein [Verrucomicrobiae bacterium]